MAVSVTHSTVATLPDEAGAEVNKAEWNAPHTVTGLGTMATQDATGVAITGGAVDGTTIGATTPAAGKFSALTFGDGSAASLSLVTNLSGATDPTLDFSNATILAAATTVSLGPTSSTRNILVNGTGAVQKSGNVFGWGSSSTDAGGANDTSFGRALAGGIVFGGATAAAGGATTRTEFQKTVIAFTNGVAKATFTVTIPNAAHTATLEFEFTAFLGAGGTIGTNEAAATTSCKVIVTRTPGVNAVASAVSTAFGAVAANVAGATTATVAAAVSAIAGAVGATNTFTLDVTITRGGGSSDNHVCLCYGKLMNANASGITIA
jgi:hypothetical protein